MQYWKTLSEKDNNEYMRVLWGDVGFLSLWWEVDLTVELVSVDHRSVLPVLRYPRNMVIYHGLHCSL